MTVLWNLRGYIATALLFGTVFAVGHGETDWTKLVAIAISGFIGVAIGAGLKAVNEHFAAFSVDQKANLWDAAFCISTSAVVVMVGFLTWDLTGHAFQTILVMAIVLLTVVALSSRLQSALIRSRDQTPAREVEPPR